VRITADARRAGHGETRGSGGLDGGGGVDMRGREARGGREVPGLGRVRATRHIKEPQEPVAGS
jgi:hypothetical protein